MLNPYTCPYYNQHNLYHAIVSKHLTGHRVERSTMCLASNLDLSIRDAGVQAVDRVEEIMRKWVKFFGGVVMLTLVLLPLPAVNVSMNFA